MDKSYIQTAADAVVQRGESYGHPADNHGCTAWLWNGYLDRKYGTGHGITPEDVCILMILQKISRQAASHSDDNIVDIIGYAENIGMILQAGRPGP